MKQIDHLDAAGKTVERVVQLDDEDGPIVTVFDDDTFSVILGGDYGAVYSEGYFELANLSPQDAVKIFGDQGEDLWEEAVVEKARREARSRLGKE